MPARRKPTNFDEYIAACPADVQPILEKVRATIKKVVPGAEEKISYLMPAFKLDGYVIYFAAFKNHIGMFPPVKGDDKLTEELARYRGPKGNLQFPLDEPIPYTLIRKVVKARLNELRDKAKRGRKSKS